MTEGNCEVCKATNVKIRFVPLSRFAFHQEATICLICIRDVFKAMRGYK